ncbi:ribonuclease H-like domain-containing protein [Tanacetum coccineum]|uniref:Ribonuclease H-like domain-containing protein n=1 Tax=Tanacetum coccineum TaxID=301880 RepID=A0ABQ4XWV7_9ASTR
MGHNCQMEFPRESAPQESIWSFCSSVLKLQQLADKRNQETNEKSTSSTSTSQNLAFLSSENTSSTNEVSTASGDFRVSTAGGISQVSTTPCAHDVACSFFAQPTTSPQLENEDFQQIDEDECQKLSATTVTEKGTLLGNADLEGIKGEDLMVTMAGAMHQQMNLHHRHCSLDNENSDDEDDVCEVQTVSPVKTNEIQTVKTRVDKIGQTSQKQGIGFKKIKACFVCKSTDHLIKDCNFHDKQSQEPKLKNVVNTGPRVVKPVWDNAKRVNHQKISKYPHFRKTFVPSGVLTRTARPVSTVRLFALKIAQTSGAIRPIYPRMDNVRPRGSYSPIKRSYYTKPAFRPKDLKQDVKTFGVQNMTTAGTRAVVNTGKGKMDIDLKKSRWVWRPKGNYLDHVSKDSGSFMLKKVEYVDPKGISMSGYAVVDSGCSSHMTGNKAYLSDYEDYNGGFVAFGSDPKGDELKFNLFSVSQMCDKKNSVLFTKTECLILSPSFKLLDESQVVLRAPRKDDVYSLDLKNIILSRERKNRTLIEAARTMLAYSLLPIPFWAEAVNTACYVLNRVLVTKPQNKTPYELLIGNSPSISFMRPFGCPLTILNTLDSLGKFDGKSDEGYLLGYSTTSKAFRVYNKRTKRVEENLHIDFLEDQPNVAGTGPNWMFDLDFLTNSMNYIPVSVENQVNVDAGTQDSYVAGSSGKDKGPTQEYILLPLQPHRTRIPVEDVAPAAHEKPSESSPKDNDVQDLEDDKEGQH